jgi:rhodanese-related sulfurtransferase
VKGRVPFLFVNIGVNTDSVYPHIYRMHLDRMSLRLPQGELRDMAAVDIVANIQAQGVSHEAAVVVLCEDGVKSLQVAEALEKASYINVFYVKEGWKQLLTDNKSS